MTFWVSPSVSPRWSVPGGRSRLRGSRERADFFFGDSSFKDPWFDGCCEPLGDGADLASLGVSEE